MAYKEIYTKPDGGIPDSDIASANTWNNKVPSTRKVNGKALSSDIDLTASDVGALPTSGGSLTGNLTVGSSNIGTNGYIEGTWLRTTKATESAGDFATISGGWIYKRAPANVLGDIGGQPKITANGILKGDGTGNITAADETEVELVDITPESIGAQPKITANGFLRGMGDGSVLGIDPTLNILLTYDDYGMDETTGEKVYYFRSQPVYENIQQAYNLGCNLVIWCEGRRYYLQSTSDNKFVFSGLGSAYKVGDYREISYVGDGNRWSMKGITLISKEGIFREGPSLTLSEVIQNLENEVGSAQGEVNSLKNKIASITERKMSIVLYSYKWTGSDPYTQRIGTEKVNTKADIQPSEELYDQLVADGIGYLAIKNVDGTLTAVAKGNMPTVDLTVQMTLKDINSVEGV